MSRQRRRFSLVVQQGRLRRTVYHGALCDTPGCRRFGRPCWLPDDLSEAPGQYYCWEHAYDAGYCVGCGMFWAGIESFDFSRTGLCENCASQGDYSDEDDGDWDEDALEWDDLPHARSIYVQS